jgi:hypothetical protein
MDLTFSEMDTLATNNYWDTQPNANTKPKKKVTFGYDDILSSINLVVNPQGVLQYMTPTGQGTGPSSNPSHNPSYNSSPYTSVSPYPSVKKVGVDPQVKNSAIFNKYFKNYRDPNEVQEVKIPKTREELKQMLIEQHVKRVQAQKRIAQIKPKKMLFGVGSGMDAPPIYTAPLQQQHSLNKMFRLK